MDVNFQYIGTGHRQYQLENAISTTATQRILSTTQFEGSNGDAVDSNRATYSPLTTVRWSPQRLNRPTTTTRRMIANNSHCYSQTADHDIDIQHHRLYHGVIPSLCMRLQLFLQNIWIKLQGVHLVALGLGVYLAPSLKTSMNQITAQKIHQVFSQ